MVRFRTAQSVRRACSDAPAKPLRFSPAVSSDDVKKAISSLKRQLNEKATSVLHAFPPEAQTIDAQTDHPDCFPIKILVGHHQSQPIYALQQRDEKYSDKILLHKRNDRGEHVLIDIWKGKWTAVAPFSFLALSAESHDTNDAFVAIVQYYLACTSNDITAICRPDWAKGVIRALLCISVNEAFLQEYPSNNVKGRSSEISQYSGYSQGGKRKRQGAQANEQPVRDPRKHAPTQVLATTTISQNKVNHLRTFVGEKWSLPQTKPYLAVQHLFKNAHENVIEVGTIHYPKGPHSVYGFLFPSSDLSGEPEIQFHELDRHGRHFQALKFNQYKHVKLTEHFRLVWTEKQLCAVVKYYYLAYHARGSIHDPTIPLSPDFEHQLQAAMARSWDVLHPLEKETARKRATMFKAVDLDDDDVEEISADESRRGRKRARWAKSDNDSIFTYDSRVPPMEELDSIAGKDCTDFATKIRQSKIEQLGNVQLKSLFDEDTDMGDSVSNFGDTEMEDNEINDDEKNAEMDWSPLLGRDDKGMSPGGKKLFKSATAIQQLKLRMKQNQDKFRRDLRSHPREEVEEVLDRLVCGNQR